MPIGQLQNLCATKFSHWRYEREVRLLVDLHDQRIAGRPDMRFMPLDECLELKKIFMGEKSLHYLESIENALGTKDIPIFQTRAAFSKYSTQRRSRLGSRPASTIPGLLRRHVGPVVSAPIRRRRSVPAACDRYQDVGHGGDGGGLPRDREIEPAQTLATARQAHARRGRGCHRAGRAVHEHRARTQCATWRNRIPGESEDGKETPSRSAPIMRTERLCCKPDVGVSQIRTTTMLASCLGAGQTVL